MRDWVGMVDRANSMRMASRRRWGWRLGWRAGLAIMGLFYVVAGINHFRSPLTYLAIMPPYIPWPMAMIYITGVAEILGGIGVLVPDGFVFPRIRAFAAWGLVLMLIAFLPVHINMCLHPDKFPQLPVWILWARVVLQMPLIGWAWYYTRRSGSGQQSR